MGYTVFKKFSKMLHLWAFMPVLCVIVYICDGVVFTENKRSRSTLNEECGKAVKTNVVPLITNSLGNARITDYPWHAAIYKTSKDSGPNYQCGGSLVTRQHVITAAHCASAYQRSSWPAKPNTLIVYLGLENRESLKTREYTTVQKLTVSSIRLHAKFNASTLHNDLAILRLGSQAQITDFVRPICLWSGGDSVSTIINELGSIAGWGANENGNLENRLKHVRLPVVSEAECLRSNTQVFGIFSSGNDFCAGFKNGTSVCNGDSGGGMAFIQKGTENDPVWQLRGIVSLAVSKADGGGFCDPNQYVVFTDVAKYRKWIDLKLHNRLTIEEKAQFLFCFPGVLIRHRRLLLKHEQIHHKHESLQKKKKNTRSSRE